MKFALLKKEDELTIDDWLKMSTTIYNEYSDWSITSSIVISLTHDTFWKPKTYNPAEKPKREYILHTCTKNGYKYTYINEEKALRLFNRRGKKIIEGYCKFMASAPYPIINPLFCLVGRINEFIAMNERRFGYIAGFEMYGETKSAKSWDSCLCKKYGVSKRDFAIGRITLNANGKRVISLEPIPWEVVMELDPIDVEINIQNIA